MLIKNSKWFTTGQFAKLHKINKKTLIWYDEIGLLKPAYRNENGYRYYSYQQSATLETILMLRELHIPLEEIKNFMENRTMDTFAYLLQEQIAELKQTITHLQSIQKVLHHHKQDMEMLRTLDLSAITYVEKQNQYLVTMDISQKLPFEKTVAQVVAEAEKYQLNHLHDAIYGTMIPVTNLYQEKFDDYAAVYMKMPFSVSRKGLHLQPAGRYLRAFCKGNWDKIPDKYREILAYAKKNKVSLYGYAYETGINELVIDDIEDYITQIEIPIKPE